MYTNIFIVNMAYYWCIIYVMEQKRLTLRIPIKLYETLVRSTGLSGKTLTGEILDRLNSSYEKETELDKKIRSLIQEELAKTSANTINK
jgi:hypothetical protein